MKSFVRIAIALLVALVLSGALPACSNSQTAPNSYPPLSAPIAVEPDSPILSNATASVGSAVLPAPLPDSRQPAPRDVAAVGDAAAAPAVELGETSRARAIAAPPATAAPPQPFADDNLFIHSPPNASKRQPLRVLVVLHGMGGRGDQFARNLIAAAEQNGWLLIAPTINYGDWQNTAQLLQDDLRYTRMLRDTLDVLPKKVGLKLRRHVLLYGFSRGAQLAHRFALFYPEYVETVAALSAGAYTLPIEQRKNDKGTQVLKLPYGIGDMPQHVGRGLDLAHLKQISFWVAVGANDNRPSDLTRDFDAYCGTSRVERARAFETALKTLGVDAHLTVFKDADHEVTSEMRARALEFLRNDELADRLDD